MREHHCLRFWKGRGQSLSFMFFTSEVIKVFNAKHDSWGEGDGTSGKELRRGESCFNFVETLRVRLRETSCGYCSYVALYVIEPPLSDSNWTDRAEQRGTSQPLKGSRAPQKTLKSELTRSKLVPVESDKPFSLASPCKDRFHPGPLTISGRICPARTSPTLSSPGQEFLTHLEEYRRAGGVSSADFLSSRLDLSCSCSRKRSCVLIGPKFVTRGYLAVCSRLPPACFKQLQTVQKTAGLQSEFRPASLSQ